jgi:hypothetical protein
MKLRHIFQAAFGIVLLAMVFSIALSAQSGKTHIQGVVKSSSGKLFTSVWVTISQNNVEKGRSLTGDDGKYYISNLTEGVYDIVVREGNRQLYKGQVNLSGDGSHDILIGRTR